MRGSRPGERRGGRRKGTPNKTTTALKEAILEAAEVAGGKAAWSGTKTNTSAFATLLGKVLPLQVTGEDGGSPPSRFSAFIRRPGIASCAYRGQSLPGLAPTTSPGLRRHARSAPGLRRSVGLAEGPPRLDPTWPASS